MISYEQLVELLDYNPDTGVFTWKQSRGGLKKGSVAGTLRKDEYIHIKLKGTLYYAHRLAWLWCMKEWPSKMLDHINGIRNDNNLDNLREANNMENQYNRNKQSNNKTGYKGVSFRKDANKYQSQISVGGKQMSLGHFNTAEEASQAYQAAETEYYKEFKRESNNNIP